jgi:WD40 repeat protein
VTFWVWHREDPQKRTIETPGGGSALAFDPAGTRLAMGRFEQLILRGHPFLVSGLSFSADGTRLASASPDGAVRVWALVLDDLIHIAEQHVTRSSPMTNAGSTCTSRTNVRRDDGDGGHRTSGPREARHRT